MLLSIVVRLSDEDDINNDYLKTLTPTPAFILSASLPVVINEK